MPFENLVETDENHVGHDGYHIETLHDNPVEYTEWWHCNQCNIDFPKKSVTIIEQFVCDRCGGDPTTLYTKCATCGPIYFCDDCVKLHDAELGNPHLYNPYGQNEE